MPELSFGLKIWGDISNLAKSLTKGKEEVASFKRGADSSFKDLTKAVSIAENSFKKFAVQLGINSKEAQASLKEYHKLKSELTSINNALRPPKESAGMFAGLKGELVGLTAGFMGITALAGGVASFFKMAVTGAMEDERANRRLLGALDGNSEAFSRMDQWKDQMMSKTLFTEDEIRGAVTMGTEMGKTESQTKKMVETAMGLSRVTGQDLNTVMLQLSQALDGNVGRLSKYIPGWKEMSEEQRKSVDIIEALSGRFGKLASEGLNTTEGKIIQAKIAFEEFGDSIGNKVIPVLGSMINLLNAKVLGNKAAEIRLLKDQIAMEQKLSDLGTGIRTKGAASSRLIKLKEELRVLEHQENMAKMITDHEAKMAEDAEKRKQELSKNPLLDQLREQITLEEEAAKAAKKAADEKMKAWGALLNAKMTGPVATFGQVGENQPITRMGKASTFQPMTKVANPFQSEIGKDPKIMASDWINAFEEVKQAARGLSGGFQAVFNSIADLGSKIATKFSDGWRGAMEAIGAVVSSTTAAIGEIFSRANDRRLADLDAYYIKERDRIEASKMGEQQKQRALQKLDEDTNTKKKALMREQAKQQKVVSLMQATIAGALAVVQAFAIPLVGAIMGPIMAGLVAAQIAAIASEPLPALAEGGLAMAPTMALVGDNKNASIDPEVIAPLSKLKDIMFGDGGGGMLTARISGDDLLFILDRAQRSKARRY